MKHNEIAMLCFILQGYAWWILAFGPGKKKSISSLTIVLLFFSIAVGMFVVKSVERSKGKEKTKTGRQNKCFRWRNQANEGIATILRE